MTGYAGRKRCLRGWKGDRESMSVKCPKCQFNNRVGAKFCKECGAELELVCPSCSSPYTPGSKFCDECGQALGEPKASPAIDYSEPYSYTPKFLADKIIDTRKSIEGERKLVTVLFADVANYTSISEKLDPEEVHQIMDGCFKVLMDETHRYEGTIDKFTGDGIMALFGAPVAHEDHAQRACYAALAIQKAIGEYGDKLDKECGVEFKMRIGLNSGLVIVGSVGNDLRMDYTAIGDTTNLASRMETRAKPSSVLVSEDTYKLAKDFFKFEPVGEVEVKGKEEPVEAYQLMEVGEVETRIGASVARGLTKFVGRQREIAALKDAFEKVQSGSGQVIGIVGEAGVGKSRLLLELRAVLPEQTHTYLEGQCLHYGGSMAYLPILDILRAYFDVEERDREFVIKKKIIDKLIQFDGNLKEILPPLHEIFSLKIEDEEYPKLDLQKKREMTFEAIRDLLIRESQNRPIILALDDLQWIDKISEDFMTYLIGWLANARILLIILYRPEYTHLWASKSCYNQIRVDQLTADTSAELVQSLLVGGDLAPELRELILTRAAGNPFFMEEFTHTLLENGSIQKKDHQYVLSRKASDIQVPDTIQGIIAARMDRLEDNLKRTMQVASVIGRDFAYRVLQTITGTREELKSYLLNLQGLEFIYEKSLFPELEYIFKHALTQEVAYNSLLLKRRKEIHERIGKAIEELYPDRLEEFYEALAFHFEQGESRDKAIDYHIRSGEKSSDRYAVEEAHRHFQEAFDILFGKPGRTKDEDCLLIDLLIKWAYVFFFRGDFRGLNDLLNAHKELAESLNDKARLGMFYAWLGLAIYARGKVKDSYEYLKKALRLGEETGDQQLIGYAYTGLTWTCAELGLLNEAIAFGERAQEISQSFESDHYLYFESQGGLGIAYSFMGATKRALASGKAILEYGQRHTSIRSLVMGHYITGVAHQLGGDITSAIESLRQAVEVSADSFYDQFAKSALGACYALNGQLQEGEDTLQEVLAYSREFGSEGIGTYSQAILGVLLIAKGQMNQGLGLVEDAQRECLENGRKYLYALSYYLLGKLYLQIVEGAAPVSVSLVLKNIGFLIKNVPFAKQKATENFKKTIEIAGEIGAKGLMGMAYLDLSLLHKAKSEKDKAKECISMATRLFEECDAETYLAQAKEVLESL
jgi:class 3 adenylate cyclase/tetratricopeptide (TPR) repeat protein/energy-coupling factor transporter ATP-binding protein EcfA2